MPCGWFEPTTRSFFLVLPEEIDLQHPARHFFFSLTHTEKKPRSQASTFHPCTLLSGPPASMDEWQLQSSLASSCSPCMEACSITKTGWRWCESSFLQSTLPRRSLYTSAISQIPTPGWICWIKSESIRASLISKKTKRKWVKAASCKDRRRCGLVLSLCPLIMCIICTLTVWPLSFSSLRKSPATVLRRKTAY